MHENSTPRCCVWCGNPIVRRDGEQASHFEKRISCGPACANRYRWQRDKTRLASKTCVVCGGLIRHDSTKPYQHRKRETCSDSCKITLANRRRYAKQEPSPKPCAICGTEMRRRDGEMIAGFKLRKTCGKVCHALLISRQKIAHHFEIRATPYPPEFTEKLKDQIRARDGYHCQVCGAPELAYRSHAVHHVDYDKAHCDPSNLVTLCQPCHVRTNWDRDKWESFFRELLSDV